MRSLGTKVNQVYDVPIKPCSCILSNQVGGNRKEVLGDAVF